jgi:hypothetical protein
MAVASCVMRARFRPKPPAVLLSSLVFAACSSPDGGASAERTSASPFVMSIDASVGPAREEYLCRYFVIPEGGLDVSRFVQRLGPRAHHLLVFHTTLTAADVAGENDVIRQCNFDVKSHSALGGLLYGGQPGTRDLAYPPDVALNLSAGQVVLLELHVVNESGEDHRAHAELELGRAPAPPAFEAGILHYYDWAIDVPPLGSGRTRMRCAVPEPLTLVFLHGHMHARGRDFRAWIARAGRELPLHETRDWDEPTRVLEPGVRLEAGDAVEFECVYENDSSWPLRQGLSALADEMCSLTAGYFTDSGRRLDAFGEGCALPDSGVVGHGALGCAEIEGCLAAAVASSADAVEMSRATQPCWLAGCPRASLAFHDLALCRFVSCEAVCGLAAVSAGLVSEPADPAACEGCLAEHCAREVSACGPESCESS